ncbi:MAG: glycosyltransferase 87 family protein [Candidatus Binatales bacterium]
MEIPACGDRDWLRRMQAGVRPSLVLALLLLLNPLFNVWQYATNSPGIDFFTLWGVPHVLKTNAVPNIYAADSQRDMASVLISESSSPQVSDAQRQATAITAQLYDNRVDVTGSPLVYALVGLTAGGAYEKDLSRFTVASWLCFVGATLIFCRLLQFSPVSTLLIVGLFTSSFAPLISDMRVANLNQIQLLLVACFLLFFTRSWGVLAGLALGIAVMLKPNVLIVAFLSVLVSLADRDYRSLTRLVLGMGLAALLSVAISVSYFGRPAMWPAFIRSVPHTLATSYPMEHGNFSLPLLLFRTMPREMSTYIFVILMAIVSVVIFKTRWDHAGNVAPAPSRDADESARSMHRMFVVVGLGSAVMLMSSRLAWLHYYVLLIPLELYLIRPLAGGDRPQRRLVVSIFAAIGFCLLSSVTQVMVANTLQQSIAVNMATALMFILALCETWWQSTVSPSVERRVIRQAREGRGGRDRLGRAGGR